MRPLDRLPFWGELAARFGVALLVPVVLVGGLLLVVPRFTELPDGVALQVAGEPLTEDRFADRVAVLEALYGVRVPADPAEADRFRRLVARTTAIGTVIDRAAGARGVTVPPEVVDARVAELVAAQGGPPGRPGLVALLSRIGASEQDLRDEIVRRETHERLFDSVAAAVSAPSDEEARAAYDQRRSALVAPEQRHLRNIVTDTRQEADDVLARARTGEDFAALARAHSRDRATREQGGDLGFLARDQVLEPYAAVAFAAEAGQFYGPLRNEFGWNVGQVVEVRPAHPLSPDEALPWLRAQLRAERAAAAWDGFLGAEIAAADVVYAPAYRPADPDTLLPPPVASAQAVPR